MNIYYIKEAFLRLYHVIFTNLNIFIREYLKIFEYFFVLSK